MPSTDFTTYNHTRPFTKADLTIDMFSTEDIERPNGTKTLRVKVNLGGGILQAEGMYEDGAGIILSRETALITLTEKLVDHIVTTQKIITNEKEDEYEEELNPF